jgi:hypothetical protein
MAEQRDAQLVFVTKLSYVLYGVGLIVGLLDQVVGVEPKWL